MRQAEIDIHISLVGFVLCPLYSVEVFVSIPMIKYLVWACGSFHLRYMELVTSVNLRVVLPLLYSSRSLKAKAF